MSKTSPYGHRLSAMTGKIDLLLYEGRHSAIEIVNKLGCSLGRLSAHIQHLKKRGFLLKIHPKTGALSVIKITIVRRTVSDNEN